MEEQLTSGEQRLRRAYTDEERRRRWFLIVNTILCDPGPDVRPSGELISPAEFSSSTTRQDANASGT